MDDEQRFIYESLQTSRSLAEVSIQLPSLMGRLQRRGISSRDAAETLELLCEQLITLIARFIRAEMRMARLRRDIQILHKRTIDYTPGHNDGFRGSRRLQQVCEGPERITRALWLLQGRLDAAGIP